MFKIETEYGTFEAFTEKEAMKLLAKGKKAYQKAQAELSERRQNATMRADAMGYNILRRVLAGEKFPQGWRLHQLGHSYSAVRPVESDYRRWPEMRFECADGTFQTSFAGFDFLGAVTNGSGYAILFFLRDGTTNETQAYSVGANGDCGSWSVLPGVTPEMFQREESAVA